MRDLWLCLSLLTMAAPVAAQQGVAPKADAPATTVTNTATAAAPLVDYKLGVADKVRIIVFNEDTLSGEFTVSDSGTLSLPLIGDVKAIGRTPREVIQDIEAKLADGYLRQPRVSMDVLTYRPFYILGEVSKPGEYPYSNGLSALNAVARAEGFTYRANKKKIFIKRFGETMEREYKLDSGVTIYPGDTVRVGERYF
ncbi:polysaccharide biosynthesis/export family protein [Sphingomonas sp. UMB7805-LC452B]|jgi:polysaccharide biosynthesis/export protein|uniref:Polysaccharide export protein n=2 Tax=Sphingomonas zeae TaxID=1646122 RepID=A0A7Y6B981_9SPHN|nr:MULTISPECIES: polysaccharide biosynthesis/export family protein [Sphingomonas]MDK8214417.1 polysaccharide biosynthesis/export family protein [Sphingomonas sp. UMB7805-LC452B]NUU48826.1 polysaccharide export protein [Sphingomonas zeae]